MSNSIAPGSSADVNVKVTALTTNPNVPVTYKTIILKKNLVNGINTLTQEMMSAANTKYVVKYDYVLGENIDVPDNCILEFDGGNISAGSGENKDTITGNNTGINVGLVKIFNTNITLAGSWNVAEVYPEWFGGIDEYWNERIQKAIDFSTLSSGKVILTKRTYLITGTRFYQNTPCLIVVRNNTSIISYNKSELKLAAKSYIYTEDYECVLGNAYVSPSQSYNVTIDGIRINQEEETFIDPHISEKQRLHVCVELYNCVNTTISNCSFYVKGQNAVCFYTNDPLNFNVNCNNSISNCEFISLQKNYDYDQSAVFIKSFATVVSNNTFKDVSNIETGYRMRGGIEFHGSFLTATNNTFFGIGTGFNISPHRGSLNGRNVVISNNNMTDGSTFVRIYPEDINETVQDHVELIDALINANVCTNVKQMFDVFNSTNRYKATINGLSITENIFKRSDSIGEYIFSFMALGKVKNVNINNNIIYNAKCRVFRITDTNYIVEPSIAEIENIVFSNNLIYGCFDFENTTSGEKPLFQVVITKTPIDYNKVIIKNNIIDITEDSACTPYLLKGRCAFVDNMFPHGLSLLVDEYLTTGSFDIYPYVKDSKFAKEGSTKVRNNVNCLCIGNGTDKTGTLNGTLIKQYPYSMIQLSNSNSVDVGDIISVVIGESVNITKTNVYSKVGNKITFGWVSQDRVNDGDNVSITFIEAKWRALQGDASGTWANKPSSADAIIPIGFRYFCTDKQTTEGATNGIEIIYKGNDVWVDALGRVVS